MSDKLPAIKQPSPAQVPLPAPPRTGAPSTTTASSDAYSMGFLPTLRPPQPKSVAARSGTRKWVNRFAALFAKESEGRQSLVVREGIALAEIQVLFWRAEELMLEEDPETEEEAGRERLEQDEDREWRMMVRGAAAHLGHSKHRQDLRVLRTSKVIVENETAARSLLVDEEARLFAPFAREEQVRRPFFRPRPPSSPAKGMRRNKSSQQPRTAGISSAVEGRHNWQREKDQRKEALQSAAAAGRLGMDEHMARTDVEGEELLAFMRLHQSALQDRSNRRFDAGIRNQKGEESPYRNSPYRFSRDERHAAATKIQTGARQMAARRSRRDKASKVSRRLVEQDATIILQRVGRGHICHLRLKDRQAKVAQMINDNVARDAVAFVGLSLCSGLLADMGRGQALNTILEASLCVQEEDPSALAKPAPTPAVETKEPQPTAKATAGEEEVQFLGLQLLSDVNVPTHALAALFEAAKITPKTEQPDDATSTRRLYPHASFLGDVLGEAKGKGVMSGPLDALRCVMSDEYSGEESPKHGGSADPQHSSVDPHNDHEFFPLFILLGHPNAKTLNGLQMLQEAVGLPDSELGKQVSRVSSFRQPQPASQPPSPPPQPPSYEGYEKLSLLFASGERNKSLDLIEAAIQRDAAEEKKVVELALSPDKDKLVIRDSLDSPTRWKMYDGLQELEIEEQSLVIAGETVNRANIAGAQVRERDLCSKLFADKKARGVPH